MDESCVFRLRQTRAYSDKILFAVGNGNGLLCYGPLDPRADLRLRPLHHSCAGCCHLSMGLQLAISSPAALSI